MAKVMKYFVRAIGKKLWLLLGYLALSLASHLEGAVIAKYVTAPWWIASGMFASLTLPDAVLGKGGHILGTMYQQIPRKPIYFLVCHFTLSIACVLLFLVAYTFFPWYGLGLMADGLSWLVALNMLSLGLYAAALGLTLTSVLTLLSVRTERWPKVAAYACVALVAYLLAFYVGPGVSALLELALFPLAGLTAYGEIIISDSVLHAPWQQGATNLAQITFLLILQGGILTSLLSGRVDVE